MLQGTIRAIVNPHLIRPDHAIERAAQQVTSNSQTLTPLRLTARATCRLAPLRKELLSMMRSAILWSAVRNWGPRLGTIITFFVLARILSKNELGLFAAAYSIVSLTEIFADNGFGDAVVRSKNVTFNIATTLWLINIFIACVFYGLLVGFSSQISHLMGVEDLGTILQIVGVTLLINSLGYVPQALLRKSMEFKRLAFRSVAATILGAVVGIAMAFTGFGVYSMVGQLLTSSVINTLFLWYPAVLHPARPQVRGMNEIVRFAFGVFGSRFIGYANTRLIELVIPTLFGPRRLRNTSWHRASRSAFPDAHRRRHRREPSAHVRDAGSAGRNARGALQYPAQPLRSDRPGLFWNGGAFARDIQPCLWQNGEGVAGLMLLIAILGQSQAIYYSNDVFVVGLGNAAHIADGAGGHSCPGGAGLCAVSRQDAHRDGRRLCGDAYHRDDLFHLL